MVDPDTRPSVKEEKEKKRKESCTVRIRAAQSGWRVCPTVMLAESEQGSARASIPWLDLCMIQLGCRLCRTGAVTLHMAGCPCLLHPCNQRSWEGSTWTQRQGPTCPAELVFFSLVHVQGSARMGATGGTFVGCHFRHPFCPLQRGVNLACPFTVQEEPDLTYGQHRRLFRGINSHCGPWRIE